MKKERLIDANKFTDELKPLVQDQWNHKIAPASWSHAFQNFIDRIMAEPDVDPESLPIVRELRAKVSVQNDKLRAYGERIDKLRAELARVIVDRDHAVEWLAGLEVCGCCKNTRCRSRDGEEDCNFEWIGLIAENATTEKQCPKECEDCTHCEVCGMVYADKGGPCAFREPGMDLRNVQMIAAKDIDPEELPRLIKAIQNAPATILSDNDGAVRPIARGHWFINEYEFFTCSVCGDSYYNGAESSAQAESFLNSGNTYKFCPNCGAYMREDKNDG